MIAFLRTARSGLWSDTQTWEAGRTPRGGDFVQVRAGHTVTYDIDSADAIRMVHVAGTLTFSREKSTRLEVGLLRVEPGETSTEDGFDCHDMASAPHPDGSMPVLEIGTPESPIPLGVTATVRLRHYPGTSRETLPAIVVCGGRWDVHGAPLNRTWLKLAAPARVGERRVSVEQPVSDWQVGDKVLITTGEAQGLEAGATFQRGPFGRQKPVGTEERQIAALAGDVVTLDRPLTRAHPGEGVQRSEVANLTRNVVIESADPGGVRGHTMYHSRAQGSISYAEFRHLGKEGVLGKYPLHFHLVRGTMRGSGVLGASIWGSHNRWITIHGADYLLIRDCVGYQSRGHGFFLEDATEQWNVLDRNLAVQAFGSVPLPKQVLSYDPNDGAGFWWANGRNTLIRNVACENDRYGYHFHLGKEVRREVRTTPFLRFEENESHGDGLFGFRFGDEEHGSVRSDRQHPFVARNLRVWAAHYAIRPNVGFFLLEGLHVDSAAFGIYRPDYDVHVYRDIELENITAEPLNGGHDEESVPQGDFTFERLTLKSCHLEREALLQLTHRAPTPGLSGHFRGVMVIKSQSGGSGVVDFGGGPRTNRIDNPVAYFFHDLTKPGAVTRVASVRVPTVRADADYRSIDGWTGREVRAAQVSGVAFPQLLLPRDDLPPATLITCIKTEGRNRVVRGVSHDNGTVAKVWVNGQVAQIIRQQAGVADWSIRMDAASDGRYIAHAIDRAGNVERTPHQLQFDPA